MAVTRLGLMALPMVGTDQDFSGKTEQPAGYAGSFVQRRRRRWRRWCVILFFALSL